MRGFAIALICAVPLAGCGDGRDADPMTQEEAIAAVEASQQVPAQEVLLEPIGYGDIELSGAFGFSCAFSPEGKPGVILALAMRDIGLVKAEGKMVRFAADTGSAETVAGSWSNYDSQAISFTLELTGAGQPTAPETTVYPAQLTVRDFNDETVFESTGTAECGV